LSLSQRFPCKLAMPLVRPPADRCPPSCSPSVPQAAHWLGVTAVPHGRPPAGRPLAARTQLSDCRRDDLLDDVQPPDTPLSGASLKSVSSSSSSPCRPWG